MSSGGECAFSVAGLVERDVVGGTLGYLVSLARLWPHLFVRCVVGDDERMREGGREGGRDRERVGGNEGGREGGRDRERVGGNEGGREGGIGRE